ncbi:MAG: DUF2971 domain-containing protein [Planctomycetota bacterium]
MKIAEISRMAREWPIQARFYLCWRVALALKPLIMHAREIPERESKLLLECIDYLKWQIASPYPTDPGLPVVIGPDHLRHLFAAIHGLVDFAILGQSLQCVFEAMGGPKPFKLMRDEATLRLALCSAEVVVPGLKEAIEAEVLKLNEAVKDGFNGQTIGKWVYGPEEPIVGIDQIGQPGVLLDQLRGKWAPPPQTLFRYRNSTDWKRDLDNALQGRYWYSCPLEFNDPFDSRTTDVVPDLPTFEEEFERHERPIELGLEQEYERLTSPGELQSSQESFLASRAIMCLTSNPLCAPMWAHYGGNYSGFVIGVIPSRLFTTDGSVSKFWRVDYVEARPAVDPYARFETHPEELERVTFCKKAIAWSYENEWRSITKINAGTKGRLVQLHPHSLCEVILGPRMRTDVKHGILEILKSHSGITVKQIDAEAHGKENYNLETRLLRKP